MRLLALYILFMLMFSLSWSQTSYQVVTRVLKDKHPYNGQVIYINGQNAKINVHSGSTSEVKITVKLIAKHPQLNQAKEAVNAMEFIQKVQDRSIYLNNYVLFKDKPDKQTLYEVFYDVIVPEKAQLSIKNKPGNVVLQNLKGKVEINQQMGEVTLKDCHLNLSVNQSVGGLEIIRGHINGKIQTDYVDIIMRKCTGNIDIESKFGNITMHMNSSLEKLKISGNNTEVNIINTNCYEFNYKLETSGGNISLNECIKDGGHVVRNTLHDNQNKKVYQVEKRPDNTVIDIYTKYADINFY